MNSYDDDDDDFETSIHDLDHAPAPPEERFEGLMSSPPLSSTASSAQPAAPFGRRNSTSNTLRGRLWSTESSSTGGYTLRTNEPVGSSRRHSMAAEPVDSARMMPGSRRHSLTAAPTSSSSTARRFSLRPIIYPKDSAAVDGVQQHHETTASTTSTVRRSPILKTAPDYHQDEEEEFKPRRSVEFSTHDEEQPEDDSDHDDDNRVTKAGRRIETMIEESEDEPMSSVAEQQYSSDYDDDHEIMEDDVTEVGDSSTAIDTDHLSERTCCGIGIPTANNVAVAVVKYAPCFWMRKFDQQTDQNVIRRLNVLICFFALFQVGAFAFLLVALNDNAIVDRTIPPQQGDRAPFYESSRFNRLMTVSWTINGSVFLMGALACILFLSACLTWRIVRYVDLVSGLRYVWLLTLLAPFEVFAVVGLFDYFDVTSVWVKHWWRSASMAWFRFLTCQPQDTYNTLCTVPITANETAWCQVNYNSSDCTAIRNAAQGRTRFLLNVFYYSCAGWGLLLLVLLFLAGDTTKHLVSAPIFARSKEANMLVWFSVPIFGCVLLGLFATLAEVTYTSAQLTLQVIVYELDFIGPLYLITAGLFFLAAMLGRYSQSFSIMKSSDKRWKIVSLWLFIFVMISTFAFLVVIFTSSILFIVSVSNGPMSDDSRGSIACFLDHFGDCTNCDAENYKCPEWSANDVATILQNQAKNSCTVAAIFIVYTFGATRFAFTMRKHIASYQIDYI